MKQKKILVLVHPDCVPPVKATHHEAAWADWKTEYYVSKALHKLGHQVRVVGARNDIAGLQKQIAEFKPHIVFNLLEEFNGEAVFDQHVVSLLELLEVPYTGCNPQGLSLGRDKATAKKILSYHDIKTPKFFVAPLHSRWETPPAMKFPMIVKSLTEEASLGISQESVVKSPSKLGQRIKFIHETLGTPALVEEFIQGRELYVGIIGNRKLTLLPPWELHFGDLAEVGYGIATERLKFNRQYCERHGIHRGLARNLDESLRKRINDFCARAYRALRLNGYARVDLRLTDQNEVYFLEANPNPELAWGEDFSNAAQHKGLEYPALIQQIVDLGLNWPKAA